MLKNVFKYVIYFCIIAITIYYIFNLVKNINVPVKYDIPQYISNIDMDSDGIDDQTDILNNAREYISKKPIYKSKYYTSGYTNDEYGVCTDVVAYAMLNSGYDLMKLVNEDIIANKEEYNIGKVDINIDFRRVRNLSVYFKRNAISLTLDLNDIENWQGGDIVVFKTHIGIVSDKRNNDGIPYLIHHANPFQKNYEEDVLGFYTNEIIGHYRIS